MTKKKVILKRPEDWMPIAVSAVVDVVMRKRRKTTVVTVHMHLIRNRKVKRGEIHVQQTCLGHSKFQALKFNTFQTLLSLS